MLIMFHLFSEIMFESFNIPGLYIAVQVRFIILVCSKLILIPILQSFVFSIEKLIAIMMMMMMILLLLLLYFFLFSRLKDLSHKLHKERKLRLEVPYCHKYFIQITVFCHS